ncbi:MAG TPA: STAS domain-containing protein [Mycobacteriales bacterium]|nr:STAS domain-containing protein [Mycobacteriales bacterium]
MELRVFLDRERRSLIIALSGELDFANVDVLGRALIVYGTFQFEHVIINAEALSFCDCGGLSALLAVQRMVHGTGGALSLRRIQPQVRRLLELAGLACAFTEIR